MEIIKRVFSQSRIKTRSKDGPYHLSVHYCRGKIEFTVVIEQQGIGFYDVFHVYYFIGHLSQVIITKMIEKGCEYNPFVKAYNRIKRLPNKPPEHLSLGLLPDSVFDETKFWDISPGSKEWELEHLKGIDDILATYFN